MPSLLRSLLLISCAASVLAQTNSTTDDADSQDVIGGFVPKEALSWIALVLYGISAIIHWTQYFTITPRRPFMLTLPIGMTAMAIGFVLRIIYASPPYTIGKYIPMTLFILLSPCLFLATDYMLLARLAAMFDEQVAERSLLIRSSRIVRVFVWSDVTTFLLQSAGGGLSASKNVSSAKLGNNIEIVGLAIQAVSFLLFTTVLLVFAWRIRTEFPTLWRAPNARPFKILSRQPIEDWRTLFYAMCITCIGISIRSIFRIAEFAGGYHGYIATHEGYFYIFDALPLWISMSLFCIVWPVRVLNFRPGGTELLPPANKGLA
ncbi:RTA1 like protein-domain-containing protein [Mycena crocata]|nr:RTA1 like protein-domain-containing protein [Mycena crocata]